MAKTKLTDEQVMAEIEQLKDSPYVKAAKKEKNQQRTYDPVRQKLYTLRSLEKRGRELAQRGEC